MIIKSHFKIPLYRGNFIIMFADYNVKISDHYDDLCEGFKLDYAHYFAVNHKNKQSFMIAFNLGNEYAKINHGTIAHEVFHAASAVLMDRGLELNDGSNEAYSYLINWMTDKVYEVIENNNIEISLKM